MYRVTSMLLVRAAVECNALRMQANDCALLSGIFALWNPIR